MPTEETATHTEREQTDESLRVERKQADSALEDRHTAVDEAADAVIRRARARADQVLAAAREMSDRQSTSVTPSAPIERARERADSALRSERARADETIREERMEESAILSTEREETDKDLSSERARADIALATRDEFLGVVSHDLRGLLNTVSGYADLIEQIISSTHAADEVLTYTRRIQRSGARMDRLIGDLVDVASIDAGRLAVTRELGDPSQVAAEAVDIFQVQALASGISLTLESGPSTLLVAFDPARILQVLTNLILNAIKFTPAKGQIVVRIARVDEGVQFTVTDTGPGIPADKLEAVFERFAQVLKNDRRGMGLGLYISKCIVDGHGGRIWAERADGGSSFCFTLPIQAEARVG